MPPPWKLRLDTIKEKVLNSIQVLQESTGESTLVARGRVKTLNTLFIAETRACMNDITEEDLLNYTNIQMEAEVLTVVPDSVPPILTPQKQLKLPDLVLSKFDGDILNWSEFWDRFTSSVDDRSLSNADKLAYLQSSLEKEALSAIQGLKTTNENYPVAVAILKARFGKPGLVIDAHYEALFKIKKAHSSPKECMDTFNEIEKHLRILRAMGEDVTHNNLRTTILSKFPDDVIYELKTKLKPEADGVEEMRKVLENLLTARMTSWKPCTTEALHIREPERKKITVKTKKQIKNRSDSGISYLPTASSPINALKRKGSFMRVSVERKKRKILPCIFCSRDHYNDNCDLNLVERRKKLGGRCFKCFKEGHTARNCQSKIRCYHCKAPHNTSLCPNKKEREQQKIEGSKTIQCLGKEGPTLLQTAIVTVQKGEAIWKCRAILDTGSQKSYITTAVAERMNVTPIEQSFLTVFTFGSNKPISVESPVAEIEILGETSTKNIIVNVMPYITEDVGYPHESLLRLIPSVHRTQLADDGSLGTTIDLLIGNDYYHTFVRNEKIQCGEHLYLVRSEFGWIWSGTLDHHEKECLSIITYVQDQPIQVIDSTPDRPLRLCSIHKLWDLETLGITDSPKATRDDQAVEQFNKTVKFENDRYWVKWPWYEVPPELPVNFGVAYGRLTGLLKRTDPATLEKYDAVLQDQLKRNIIEIIDEPVGTKNLVHYLPHHGVAKGDTVRLVYDASSKSKGNKSLNECLYRGPSLLENLTGLIIRFRAHKYGVLADVEKAFLQIGVQEEDRDVTRFLWLKDIHKKLSEENLLHLRFCRVPFGIGCSPFLLAITLKHHLRKVNRPICDKVAADIYVDNLVSGGDSDEECLQLYKETIEAFKDISMNMREWYTNNKRLQETVEENRRGKDVEKVSVLGVYWLKKKDLLTLKCNLESNTSHATKRKVLSHLSAVYDPCGFATPLLIAPKLFLQDIWKKKLDWDVKLPLDLQKQWDAISVQLNKIKEVEVERWYGINKPLQDKNSKVEIHCFTDASMSAYAAVVYLKVSDLNHTKISLVMSRTRLTPIKARPTYTIPRLELLGVLIGCRLIKFVTAHLPFTITNTYLWTDSQIVIQWVTTSRVLPPFVSARIMEINKYKNVEFKYVPSDQNPADLATRPCENLEAHRLWFEGPKYLHKNEYSWPPNTAPELALITRIDNEELQVIRELQKQYFPAETSGKVTDLTRNLGIFADDGVLRCRGRFKMTDWPENQKYPILLPKDNDFTRNIVEETHRRLYHVGVNQTLANVRLNYWIPHGRSQVQKVIRHCKECRKYGGGPYKRPPMPPLPKERVNISAPFTYTGTDYLGPLYVGKEGQIEKRWICLYTCLAVRAVHLEVVDNLTAEECLLSIRRFIATRGLPHVILSDNATCFKLTADVMESDYCIRNKIKWKFIPELAPWFGGTYERLVGLTKMCLKKTIDKHTLNDSQLKTVIKEIEAVLNCRPLTTVGQDLEHVLTPGDFLRAGGLSSSTIISDEVLLEPATDVKASLIEGWKKGQDILEEFRRMFSGLYLLGLRERSMNVKGPRVTERSLPQVGDIVQIKDEGKNRVKWRVGKIEKLIRSEDKEIRVAIVKLPDGEQLRRSITHLYPLEMHDEGRTEKCLGNGRDSDEGALARGSETDRKEEEEEGGALARGSETGKREEEVGHRKRRAAEEARKRMAEWTKLLFIRNAHYM